ncbi:hypothetical protein ACEPAH_1530 [Sanghuangporus vaninii]
MSVPELSNTDSSTTLGGDEMRNDDLLPGHGGADLEATTQTGVADVVDSEIGALSCPGLVSDDTDPGAIALSAILESDSDGSSSAAGFDIPKLRAIRADIDGAESDDHPNVFDLRSIPSFTPRGPLNPPTTVVKKPKNTKDTKEDTKKDAKKDMEDTK